MMQPGRNPELENRLRMTLGEHIVQLTAAQIEIEARDEKIAELTTKLAEHAETIKERDARIWVLENPQLDQPSPRKEKTSAK
jgi:uncharacterized protein (DUF3084 family)